MLKIHLENPITLREINKMIQEILKISHPNIFIIDFGNHNIESKLLKFNKTAFLTIPPYRIESQYYEKLTHFHSEERAKE